MPLSSSETSGWPQTQRRRPLDRRLRQADRRRHAALEVALRGGPERGHLRGGPRQLAAAQRLHHDHAEPSFARELESPRSRLSTPRPCSCTGSGRTPRGRSRRGSSTKASCSSWNEKPRWPMRPSPSALSALAMTSWTTTRSRQVSASRRVQQVEVDARAETLELLVEVAVEVVLLLHLPGGQLGRHLHALAVPVTERPAQPALARAAVVRPGGVDVVHAEVDGAAQHAPRLLAVDVLRVVAGERQAHGAEAEGRGPEVDLTERAVLHGANGTCPRARVETHREAERGEPCPSMSSAAGSAVPATK